MRGLYRVLFIYYRNLLCKTIQLLYKLHVLPEILRTLRDYTVSLYHLGEEKELILPLSNKT